MTVRSSAGGGSGGYTFLGTYATMAALLAAAPAANNSGSFAWVSDYPKNGAFLRSNGTRYVPVNGSQIIAKRTSEVSGIANSETIVLQALMPIGSWAAGDTVRVFVPLAKSGRTDTLNSTLRIGAAGTTADTALTGLTANGIITAANRAGGFIFDISLPSVTTAVRDGNSVVSVGSYSINGVTANPANTAISDISANALYFSFSIASSSTNDTVAARIGCSMELILG